MNHCSPQDAQPKAKPQKPKPLGVTLHSSLSSVEHPLALNPEPWLSTQITWTWGSRLAQCMSWSQCLRTPLSPFSWSASVLHYGDHPHCWVGLGPLREYSNISLHLWIPQTPHSMHDCTLNNQSADPPHFSQVLGLILNSVTVSDQIWVDHLLLYKGARTFSTP